MRKLVAESLNEVMGFERSNDIKVSLQLGKRHLIIEWLDTMGIENYTINPDWTIDVIGDVKLSYKNLIEFPDYIKFNYVSGYFDCANNQLTSLKGCPASVGGSFDCSDNQVKFTKEDVLKVCKVKPVNIVIL